MAHETRTECRIDVRARSSDGQAAVLARACAFECVVRRMEDSAGARRAVLDLIPSDGRATFTRYRCALSAEAFEEARKAQSLTIDDAWACAMVCERALREAREAPERALAVLACRHDGNATLEIVEDGGHRLSSVLELEFAHVEEDVVREEVAMEYFAMKEKLARYEKQFGALSSVA